MTLLNQKRNFKELLTLERQRGEFSVPLIGLLTNIKFTFITNILLQTLKIVNHLLTINPHAESVVSPLIERIGICLSRLKNENNV